MQLLIGILMLAAPVPVGLEALGWLSGAWEAGDAQRWTEEQWTAPRGGVMLGVSRSGGRTGLREFEFIRLAADDQGVITYWAQPGGRAPAVGFRLTQTTARSATFENAAHDYPQRIVYRRDGATLTATISDIKGGKPRSWTFRRK